MKDIWNMLVWKSSVVMLTVKAEPAQVSTWTCVCTPLILILSFIFSTKNILCFSKVLTYIYISENKEESTLGLFLWCSVNHFGYKYKFCFLLWGGHVKALADDRVPVLFQAAGGRSLDCVALLLKDEVAMSLVRQDCFPYTKWLVRTCEGLQVAYSHLWVWAWTLHFY